MYNGRENGFSISCLKSKYKLSSHVTGQNWTTCRFVNQSLAKEAKDGVCYPGATWSRRVEYLRIKLRVILEKKDVMGTN